MTPERKEYPSDKLERTEALPESAKALLRLILSDSLESNGT
jgi:hypothetical protein